MSPKSYYTHEIAGDLQRADKRPELNATPREWKSLKEQALAHYQMVRRQEVMDNLRDAWDYHLDDPCRVIYYTHVQSEVKIKRIHKPWMCSALTKEKRRCYLRGEYNGVCLTHRPGYWRTPQCITCGAPVQYSWHRYCWNCYRATHPRWNPPAHEYTLMCVRCEITYDIEPARWHVIKAAFDRHHGVCRDCRQQELIEIHDWI